MDSLGRTDLVQWLATPAPYAHAAERVEHLETHISHVFLAGDFAYKLKKPLRFDFLDFSTVSARERACREELRLNRRLAPGTYLDVVPVTQSAAGAWQLGGDGQVVEWLVQMRRLPTDQSLEALLNRGELTPAHIRRLADVLISFYRTLPPDPIDPPTYVGRLRAHMEGNRRELVASHHHLPREMVDRVHNFQMQLLALRPELFGDRVRKGRIVDGHGDLRPEHICFTDPIAIFDCLEFSADFRRIDVLDELAFLAAECDFLNAPWIGRQFLQSYEAATGDLSPAILWNFYKSYRAAVRAKVAALRAEQLSGIKQEAAAAEARRHLALANEYVLPWLRPLTIVVGGLSGTGKTTLAQALADNLGASLLRTDVVRRERYGAALTVAEPDRGLYSAQARQQVYELLLVAAHRQLEQGITVILDGTFGSAQSLAGAVQLAREAGSPLLALECVCDAAVAKQRIAGRRAAGTDVSDATPKTHDHQLSQWQPWPEHLPQLRIDTMQPLEHQVARAMTALGRL